MASPSTFTEAEPGNVFLRPALRLAPNQMEQLRRSLVSLDEEYDPSAKMLREPFSSPGYHTTLTGGFVHSTRSSLNYAVALLDTRDEKLRPRAEGILQKVISLQDQNPAHNTYGIWPWFLEEPLNKMSPPDWNWADFCGVALLQVVLDHRDRLTPDLVVQLDRAVQIAAQSIKTRDVGPGYTNIAIMGSYVTLITAEYYHLPVLREYALARWRRFYDYTLENGSFTEYNSPTYTIVALKELARLRHDATDPEARRMADEIYRIAWEDIGRHFHPPTGQWAGPHSRSYQTLQGRGFWRLLQQSTAGLVNSGSKKPTVDEARVQIACPADLVHYFINLDTPREFRETFLKGELPLVGTTRLEPAFALGSINRGNFWEQCRPLVAYWGTRSEPGYFRLRVMHDGHDFSAAQFFSTQEGGDVLAGINFATDGGDKHPSLDHIQNATITARELRVRFEFGGTATISKLTLPAVLTDPVRVQCGDVHMEISVPLVVFGTNVARWEAAEDEDNSWLDLVLYSGDERKIDFTQLEQAAASLAIHLSTTDVSVPRPAATLHEGQAQVKWGALSLKVPVRPAKTIDLQKAYAHGVSGD